MDSQQYYVDAIISERQGGWDGPRFGPAASVVRRLGAEGHRAVFVGGAVRDLCLGLPVGDVDVATSATPEMIEALFPRTVPVGKQFGVIIVPVAGQAVEVATFRHDGDPTDGRRPQGYRLADEAGDVARRDFTINTLIIDPGTDTLIDHVQGLADLRAGTIRCVGDPERRFAEDHLRVLRGLRFAARFGFTIEAATLAAMRGHPLTGVSTERILDEVRKGLGDPGRARWLALARGIAVLSTCLPPLERIDDDEATAWESALAALPAQADWIMGLALMAILANRTTAAWRTWSETWPLAKEDRHRLCALIETTPDGYRYSREADRRRMAASSLGGDLLILWEALPEERAATAAAVLRAHRQEGQTPPERLLTGEDCQHRGLAGAAIGEALRECEALQWEDQLHTQDEALRWLAAWTGQAGS